ncbi:hypothetical protein ACIP5Y_21210 [Nocardia sp. NPDC088792]|uniref:hypothetical protein n=1 Tax=Nocardia sp. NPDC088792 TaxID=3364332 RepID=UPI0038159E73
MPDPTPRGQLDAIVREVLTGEQFHAPAVVAFRLADAVFHAGWRPPARRIETFDELNALQPVAAICADLDEGNRPRSVVIRDADGSILERDVDNAYDEMAEDRHAGWWATGTGRDDIDSTEVTLPATVLWHPTVSSHD